MHLKRNFLNFQIFVWKKATMLILFFFFFQSISFTTTRSKVQSIKMETLRRSLLNFTTMNLKRSLRTKMTTLHLFSSFFFFHDATNLNNEFFSNRVLHFRPGYTEKRVWNLMLFELSFPRNLIARSTLTDKRNLHFSFWSFHHRGATSLERGRGEKEKSWSAMKTFQFGHQMFGQLMNR